MFEHRPTIERRSSAVEKERPVLYFLFLCKDLGQREPREEFSRSAYRPFGDRATDQLKKKHKDIKLITRSISGVTPNSSRSFGSARVGQRAGRFLTDSNCFKGAILFEISEGRRTENIFKGGGRFQSQFCDSQSHFVTSSHNFA